MKNMKPGFYLNVRSMIGVAVLINLLCMGMVAQARVTALLQTYNGSSPDFVTTNGAAAMSSNSLFIVYHTTNAMQSGFNDRSPLSPTGGDTVLGQYPLSDGQLGTVDGQVCGHLLKVYDIVATGFLYAAIFDYPYATFAASTNIPADTAYLLTTSALVSVTSSESAGLLTDFGGVINEYVASNGAMVANLRTASGGETGVLVTSTSSLSYAGSYGQVLNVQTVRVSNSGGSSLNYTNVLVYDTGNDWLSVSPGMGELTAGASTDFVISVSSAMSAGSYTGYVDVTSAEAVNSPQRVSVSVQIAKADQSITQFVPVSGALAFNSDVHLSAQGGMSGNVVTFTNAPGSAAVTWHSATSFTSQATGVVQIVASQAGSANYNAAPSVTNSYSVSISAPAGLISSAIDSSSYSMQWNAVSGISAYYLDVATNNAFGSSSFVTGYENKEVTTTNAGITGLTNTTPYYWRVRAGAGSTASENSTVETVKLGVTVTTVTTPADGGVVTPVTTNSFYGSEINLFATITNTAYGRVSWTLTSGNGSLQHASSTNAVVTPWGNVTVQAEFREATSSLSGVMMLLLTD
ncbi:MAG: hypothetical protein EOL87_09560 [Spartobacteria bacterium]|nr:hypothetical protein [Spartobacteria bacterium]